MRRTVAKFRSAAGEVATELRGMLRRVTVGRSGSLLWQLLGYDDGETREAFDSVEVFQGIGIAARPQAGKGEVIVGHMGGRAGHPVGIACRDASIVPSLEEDETAIFTSKATIKIDADGTITIVPDPAGLVKLGASNAVQAALRGSIYRSAETTMNTTLQAQLALIAAGFTALAGQAAIAGAAAANTAAATAATAAATAIGLFESGTSAYLSTNVNVK